MEAGSLLAMPWRYVCTYSTMCVSMKGAYPGMAGGILLYSYDKHYCQTGIVRSQGQC